VPVVVVLVRICVHRLFLSAVYRKVRLTVPLEIWLVYYNGAINRLLEDPCANDHILPNGFPRHPDVYGNNLHRPSQTLEIHGNEVWSLTSVIESRGRPQDRTLDHQSPKTHWQFPQSEPRC